MAKQEYVAPKPITSLEELKGLDAPAVQVDFTEDAWSYGAPPPAGIYKVKVFMDKEGMAYGLEDQKDPKSTYIQCSLLCKIIEGEYEGVPLFNKVNTRVYRGKNISTMAGLISKIVATPDKIPNPITPLQLAQILEKLLKKEPTVKAEVDWRGAYAYKNPKGGDDLYENVYRHYTQFPTDPEDKNVRLFEVEISNKHDGGKAVVRAQPYIARYFNKNEEPAVQKVIGAGPELVSVPELVIEEPKLVKAAQVAPVKIEVPVEDDLALMLDT